MEKKIIGKIDELVDYIISKPASKITASDYTILQDELEKIRLRKEKTGSDMSLWLPLMMALLK